MYRIDREVLRVFPLNYTLVIALDIPSTLSRRLLGINDDVAEGLASTSVKANLIASFPTLYVDVLP